jgi:omega-hydroxy-beta-dihydromenaquinone-9 sulfotransferase
MHRVRRDFALFIARRDIGRPDGKEYVLSTNGEQAKTGRSGRPKVVNEPPWWKPMIWAGCDFFAWNRLLARNRYHIHWSCLHVAIYVFFVSFFHTLLRGVQWLIYGRKVARTSIREAPIFIVGHWRTGTSLLHEILALDERHAFPTTYECMEPNHFLLSEDFFTRWLPFIAPAHRPMDNMTAGFTHPQEDEFALCMLGLPSPYLTIAFPNHPPQYEEYLDLEGLSPRALASWRRGFLQLIKALTFRHKKRLVLKSPTHSCRIKVLLEMFPDARFVHIVRNPYVVFPSTVNLWKSLYLTFGMQRPTFAGLEERVLKTFLRVYDKVEEAKSYVDFDRFYELRYEELVRDPVGQMGALYDHLGLGGFEKVLPRLQEYLAATKGYETNRYRLSDEQTAIVTERWGAAIRAYGYDIAPKHEPAPSEVADAKVPTEST